MKQDMVAEGVAYEIGKRIFLRDKSLEYEVAPELRSLWLKSINDVKSNMQGTAAKFKVDA
jgi:hypothetical protein